MKTAIRVLNYITMLVSVLASAIMLFYGCTVVAQKESDLALFAGIGLAAVTLIPLFICFITNGKLATVKNNRELLVMAIITLVLANVITGVLMLILALNEPAITNEAVALEENGEIKQIETETPAEVQDNE